MTEKAPEPTGELIYMLEEEWEEREDNRLPWAAPGHSIDLLNMWTGGLPSHEWLLDDDELDVGIGGDPPLPMDLIEHITLNVWFK